MTAYDIEREWLSLRSWLTRCVLPASAVLVLALALIRAFTSVPSTLNHNALIIGFFALYFVLVRGGHLIMIRSLHKELKSKYKDAYEERLARLSKEKMRGRNLGFTLTRIKRELLDSTKP